MPHVTKQGKPSLTLARLLNLSQLLKPHPPGSQSHMSQQAIRMLLIPLDSCNIKQGGVQKRQADPLKVPACTTQFRVIRPVPARLTKLTPHRALSVFEFRELTK
jgi:hypothetical protein